MKIFNLTQKWADSFFATDARLVFLLICLVNVLAIFIQQEFIIEDSLYFNSYGEQLAIERIEELISITEEWKWLNFVIVPISIFFQILLVTICLSIGAILLDYKLSFKRLFGLVTRAYIVFALIRLMVVVAGWQFIGFESLEDLVKMNFHSIIVFFDTQSIPKWLFYPLYTINLAQVLFFVLLGLGISCFLNQRFSKAIYFVTGTYGTGLFIWILLIVFLQLNLS